MIASLTGRLAFKAPTYLVLDVHGVGYEVFIPLSTYYGLPNLSESISLSVHTHVREDAIQLFGFLTSQEKDAFVLLTSVSGVTPISTMALIDGLPVRTAFSPRDDVRQKRDQAVECTYFRSSTCRAVARRA